MIRILTDSASDILPAEAEQLGVTVIPLNVTLEDGSILRHPGQLFTKEQIFEAVWHQDSESCLTAVTNTIGRIRQKIEDDRAVPVYIRTISNLGYQFMPNISVKKDSL